MPENIVPLDPETYINQISEPLLREKALLLHHFLLTYKGLSSRLTYNIPFYYACRWVCYLNLTKSGQLELAFTYGKLLSNEGGILKDNGRKQVAGILFNSEDEIPFEELDKILLDAIALDQANAKAGKRK